MIRILILALGISCMAHADDVLGQGEFCYRIVKDWAQHALAQVPVKNGHALSFDSQGRLFVLTDEPRNNILILDPKTGALVKHWTARMPGAHGMALVNEAGQEVLYITDTALHEVRKFTPESEELARYPWPQKSGLYTQAAEYRPSKTLHDPRQGAAVFWVLDGYGKDYVHQYSIGGELIKSWGGSLGEGENQLLHWGPHGGALDLHDPANPRLLIAMSDRQEVKRFTLEGQFIDKVLFPGGNPRDIVIWKDHLIIPHLGDKWPQDRESPGFISIVDRDFKIVSNIGAPPAVYENGVLQPMQSDGRTFIHPHAVAADAEGNLYVAQFASPAAPLLKLERIR